MAVLVILAGCGIEANDEEMGLITIHAEEVPSPSISREQAKQRAIAVGVDSSKLVYADFLPFTVTANTAQMAWGFVEKQEQSEYLVTFIDRERGNVLGVKERPGENIRDFLSRHRPASGESDEIIGVYNTFPWGWRLPFSNTDNGWMTCGYGCDYHRGVSYYSTDWDPGDEGLPVQAPAGCWALNNTWNGGYGWQFMAECGDSGEGTGSRYYYRVAHLRAQSSLVPGWWIDQGRFIGEMGSTGNSTAPHIHFTVFRGIYKDGAVNGGSLPISQWPSAADSICSGKLAGYDFSGRHEQNLKKIAADGCPP